MGHRITRRSFAAGVGTAALAGFGLRNRAHAADNKTLRFIAQSDLRVLDPIWTTAYISRNHGYMVFDTLFAIDDKFSRIRRWSATTMSRTTSSPTASPCATGSDSMTGSRCAAIDCVASLKRWMARDATARSLAPVLDEMKPDGDKSFSIKLKEPFPLLIDALAKVSSLAPFIMPERLAKTDPFTQITETIGSGPFKFVKEEFQPGHKVVYVKNTDYVPRKEPPNWASGGKVVKVDRVEWLYIPDATTKAAALNAGEADWWENPPIDLLPALAANPDIVVAKADALPAADHGRVQPSAAAFQQREDAPGGAGGRRPGRFHDRARRRHGELGALPVVLHLRHADGEQRRFGGADRQARLRQGEEAGRGSGLQGREDRHARCGRSAGRASQALVVADLLKKLGLNVEMQAMDWGTLVTRRASMKPLDRRRLEHLRDRLGRRRPARSGRQSAAAHQRRKGHGSAGPPTTRSRRCAPVDQGEQPRRPQKARRGRSRRAPSRSCPISRPASGRPRPPSART